MNPAPLSGWAQVQIFFLRLLTRLMGATDGLLKVRWGEGVISRLERRWQAQLNHLDEEMAEIKEERRRLERRTEALGLHFAVTYLAGRSLTLGRLTFDPADPHDNEILDATIQLLVIDRLAAIEPEAVGEGRYLYHLEPDWSAIRIRLAQSLPNAHPEIAGGVRQTLTLIDDAFLMGRPSGSNEGQPDLRSIEGSLQSF